MTLDNYTVAVHRMRSKVDSGFKVQVLLFWIKHLSEEKNNKVEMGGDGQRRMKENTKLIENII